MLQADAAETVGQRQQKLIVVVVARTVELVGLLHQRAVHRDLCLARLQRLGFVGKHVEVHWHLRARVEIDALVVLAGEQGRINQMVIRDRLEDDGIAIASRGFQGSGERPALGQGHAGLRLQVARIDAGRIQRIGVPLQVEHFRGHHHPALAAALRGQEIEVGDDLAHALGHVHLERIDVELVALPGQRLAVGGHAQAGQLVDRTGGRMVAGNPLRVQQGHRAGLGRHRGGHLEDAPGQIARVHIDAQQTGGRGIARRRGLRQRGRGRQREQQ